MAPPERPPLPKYGQKPDRPGLYLGLFHGRTDPLARMDDWGFDGPLLGPLRHLHTVYATELRLEFERTEDAEAAFGIARTDVSVLLDGDLVPYRGKFYGDWTVFHVAAEDCRRPGDSFRGVRRDQQFLVRHRAE